MIRIGAITQPTWVTVADGVRVLCQPVTSTVISMAKVEVAKLAVDDTEDMALRSIRFDLLCRHIARLVITEWDGVGDMEGNPVPVEPVLIDALMTNNAVFQAFQAKVALPAFALADEKKD